ncbi:MAG: hypothetical protein ABIW76_15800 [Fibrobacteria bacterium]
MGQKEKKYQAGFSLVEACIAAALSLLVGIIAHRFYRDSFHTYSQQEQIEERNQNANFTVNKLVELMQQAGSGLPDSGWATLVCSPGVLTLGSNPTGAQQFIGNNPVLMKFIKIDDATRYKSSSSPMLTPTHVLVDYAVAKVTEKFQIDTNFNSLGFSKGLKFNVNGADSLCLVTAVNLDVGDVVYGYREDQYLLVGDTLMVRPNGSAARQMVLAENIDSLGFTFRDKNGNATTAWNAMRSVSISVRAKTAKPDPRIPKPGFHKITLPMNVILRNKV